MTDPDSTSTGIRRRNLRALLDQRYGGQQSGLARATDIPQNMISDYLRARRKMGEKIARKIEVGSKIPAFALDKEPLYLGPAVLHGMMVSETAYAAYQTSDATDKAIAELVAEITSAGLRRALSIDAVDALTRIVRVLASKSG